MVAEEGEGIEMAGHEEGAETAAAADEEESAKPKRTRAASTRTTEEKAESYLNLAKALVSRDKKKAKDWAQKVIEFAPDSEAAVGAKELIQELTRKR